MQKADTAGSISKTKHKNNKTWKTFVFIISDSYLPARRKWLDLLEEHVNI